MKTERHVPHLGGEDHDDASQLQPQFARREDADHRDHQSRQKPEYRDGLQHVERGDHDLFSPMVVRRDGSVDERETQ